MNNWWKIGYPRKCVTFFSKHLDLTVRSVGFWWKSSTSLSKLHLTRTEDHLKKNNFSKNLVFHMFMGLTGENILMRQHNLVCSFLTRLSFPILELIFEIFCPQFRIFSSVSGFQYELLPYLAQKFRHSRQEFILRVQTNIRKKTGFRLENVTVFHKHLDFTQKLSDFRWWNSARLSGLPFTCPEDHFEEKQLLERTMFFIYFWNLEWKIIWPGTTLFVHCWQNCVF